LPEIIIVINTEIDTTTTTTTTTTVIVRDVTVANLHMNIIYIVHV